MNDHKTEQTTEISPDYQEYAAYLEQLSKNLQELEKTAGNQWVAGKGH